MKQKLSQLIAQNQFELPYFWQVLADNTQPLQDEEVQQTGLPIARERMLSPMFIQTENYGTSSSAVVLVNYKNEVFFAEKRYAIPNVGILEEIQTFNF